MRNDTQELYIPALRTRHLEWKAEGDESGVSFEAKVRADLTEGELADLVWSGETKMDDLRDMFAPFVLSWNVGRIGERGKPEVVPAPAVGGGQMFKAVPVDYFWWLVREIKLKSVLPPDPKSSAPAEPTVAP